jgi:hypothetical protein
MAEPHEWCQTPLRTAFEDSLAVQEYGQAEQHQGFGHRNVYRSASEESTAVAQVEKHWLLENYADSCCSSCSSHISTRLVSIKTMIILIETQRSLLALSLPVLHGPDHLHFQDLVSFEENSCALKDVSFELASNTRFDAELSAIVRKCPCLIQLHLRFSRQHGEAPTAGMLSLSNSLRCRQQLLEQVTQLTLRHYDFNAYIATTRNVCLAALPSIAAKYMIFFGIF